MLKKEGYDLMGAAFEIYNELGYGMAEEVYQQSLEIELRLRGIPFQSKAELIVFYKDEQLATHYRPDLLVVGGIVAELKAVTELQQDHEAQLFNYMRIARQTVGHLFFAEGIQDTTNTRLPHFILLITASQWRHARLVKGSCCKFARTSV